MSYVKKVEAAVGEDHAFTGLLEGIHLPFQSPASHYLFPRLLHLLSHPDALLAAQRATVRATVRTATSRAPPRFSSLTH